MNRVGINRSTGKTIMNLAVSEVPAAAAAKTLRTGTSCMDKLEKSDIAASKNARAQSKLNTDEHFDFWHQKVSLNKQCTLVV
jgi:hypothetical protein